MSDGGAAEHGRRTAVRVGCRELALACVIVAVVTGLLGWVAVSAPWARRRPPDRCRLNLHQLSMALRMYAQDTGGRYPPRDDWSGHIRPWFYDDTAFHCPKAPNDPVGYALSRDAAGRERESVPAETLILWDAEFPGGAPAFRHDGHLNAVHADGRTARLSRSEFEAATKP